MPFTSSVCLSVQANDQDLDTVFYSIISGDNSSNFVMDKRSGVVHLVSHRNPHLIAPYYRLYISASDGLHVSQAILTVGVLDINNHKPVFRDCRKYQPVISEDVPYGSPVLKVCTELLRLMPHPIVSLLVVIIVKTGDSFSEALN